MKNIYKTQVEVGKEESVKYIKIHNHYVYFSSKIEHSSIVAKFLDKKEAINEIGFAIIKMLKEGYVIEQSLNYLSNKPEWHK